MSKLSIVPQLKWILFLNDKSLPLMLYQECLGYLFCLANSNTHTLTRNCGQGPLEPARHSIVILRDSAWAYHKPLMSQQLISQDLLQAVLHCYIDSLIIVKQHKCPCQKMQQAAKHAHKQDQLMHTAALSKDKRYARDNRLIQIDHL